MALSKVSSKETEELLEKGKKMAGEMIELLQDAIGSRRRFAKSLYSIAEDLDHVKENVNIAKIIGTSVGIAGTVAGIAATALTGGLAAPIALGVGGAIAGGVTNVTADLIGNNVSKKKLHESQTILNKDKEVTEKIEKKHGEVRKIANTLSRSFNISEEEIIGLLMFDGYVSASPGAVKFGVSMVTTTMLLSIVSTPGMLQILKSAGKGTTMAVGEISAKALARIFGVALVGALLVYDVVTLVNTIVDTVKGSPTEAATLLREAARKIEEAVKDIEQILKEQRKAAEELESKLQKQFMDLIEKVSRTQCATEAEQDTILNYMRSHASYEWKQLINTQEDLKKIVENVADIISYLYTIIQQNRDKIKNGRLEIILIGHGSVDYHQMLPVGLYYMNSCISNICLYSPWGCAVDAFPVYGIATGLIRPENRWFRYPPNLPFPPEYKFQFNDLPRSGCMIPTATFYPIRANDPAFQSLLGIHAYLQAESNSLVIPYYDTLIPLPKAPLWVVVNALALIGAINRMEIKFSYAACLSWDDGTPVDLTLDQYCFVPPMQPPVAMTCSLPNNRRPSPQFQTNYNNFQRSVRRQ